MEIFYYTQIYYDYNYLSLHLFIFSVGIINLKKKTNLWPYNSITV